MRATYSPCSRCKGKGQIKGIDYDGEANGEANGPYVDCARCDGTGVERKLHDDHVRCTCGAVFHSVSELAAHRKAEHR